MKAQRDSLPRSEGERLLREKTYRKSLATIARELGRQISQDVISKWLHGARRPTVANRATICGVYDIPVIAWDEMPNFHPSSTEGPEPVVDTVLAPLPLPAPVAASSNGNGHSKSGPPPSTLDDCLGVLERIRAQRNRLNLTPGEQMKLADSEARLLMLRARLERDAERSEDRIVREHPAWKRLMRVIRKTLKDHPLALKALAVALQEDLEAQQEQAL